MHAAPAPASRRAADGGRDRRSRSTEGEAKSSNFIQICVSIRTGFSREDNRMSVKAHVSTSTSALSLWKTKRCVNRRARRPKCCHGRAKATQPAVRTAPRAPRPRSSTGSSRRRGRRWPRRRHRLAARAISSRLKGLGHGGSLSSRRHRPSPLLSPPPLRCHHPACPGGPLARQLANTFVKEFKRFWGPDRHWIARMKRAMTTEEVSKPSKVREHSTVQSRWLRIAAKARSVDRRTPPPPPTPSPSLRAERSNPGPNPPSCADWIATATSWPRDDVLLWSIA